MTELRKLSSFWNGAQLLPIVALAGWGAARGGWEVWRALQTGLLRHGKGPDVALDDRPLLFWTLNGFYSLCVLVTAGLAVFYLVLALHEMTRKKGGGR